MKKQASFYTAYFVVLAALMLTGCGGENIDSTLPSSVPETLSPVTTPAPAPPTPVSPEPTVEPAVEESPDTTVSVTDATGRLVVLPEPAKKLLGTHNPTLNIAIVIGGGGRFVAGFGNKDMAGLYEYVFPELEEVPQVGKEHEIDLASAIKVNAELAIIPERHADLIVDFEGSGIPTAVIIPNDESFETIKNSVKILGALVGEDEHAAEVINYVDSKIIAAKAISRQSTKKPTALFLGDASPLTVANGLMLQSDILEMAGAVNLAKDVKGEGKFITVRIQEIIDWNPEVIYIPVYAQYTIEDIMSNSRWNKIQAVQNGRVYVFPCELEPWDYPTPSAAIGLMWLMNNLYPELYSKEKVLADANEYYNLVYKRTFNAGQLGL
jgi:iron complex transport system substrate-binding protein